MIGNFLRHLLNPHISAGDGQKSLDAHKHFMKSVETGQRPSLLSQTKMNAQGSPSAVWDFSEPPKSDKSEDKLKLQMPFRIDRT